MLDPDNILVYSTAISQRIEAGQTANNIPFQVPVDNFKQNGEYRLQAFAITNDNIVFRADSDKERLQRILAQYPFEYIPPAKSVQVQIISQPSVQYDKNILEIKELRITDKNNLLFESKKFIKYQIVLLDDKTTVYESKFYDFNLDNPLVKLNLDELPANLIPTDTSRRYNLIVRIIAPNKIETESEPFSFD